jgi:hypothetical protein
MPQVSFTDCCYKKTDVEEIKVHKWFIKITPENIVPVNKWLQNKFGIHPDNKHRTGFLHCNHDMFRFHDTVLIPKPGTENYREISFDEFKQLIQTPTFIKTRKPKHNYIIRDFDIFHEEDPDTIPF